MIEPVTIDRTTIELDVAYSAATGMRVSRSVTRHRLSTVTTFGVRLTDGHEVTVSEDQAGWLKAALGALVLPGPAAKEDCDD